MHAEFRRILIDLDVAGARAFAARAEAHLPQLGSDASVLATLHMARTAAQTIPPRHRYYSHRWLEERGLPSQLPDHLKRPAERMYPRIVDAVGVVVRSAIPEIKTAITGVMNHAILDCYGNDDRDPFIVKTQMIGARARERKALGLPARPELPPLWRPNS